tara:strand:- start:52 stop:1674 length:1623 start_codon:yes stop_codon:yes gene_type:complete
MSVLPTTKCFISLVFLNFLGITNTEKTKYTIQQLNSRLKVLLISPMYNSSIVAPCLGLGYLASALKKNGHDVLILDGLREKIEYNPSEWDIVGVSAMSTYFPECIEEVKKAKSYGLKTIIGGPHIICDPIQSLIDSGADYAAIGEGERTMTQLAAGLPPAQVDGLAYWNNGKVVQSKQSDSMIGETESGATTFLMKENMYTLQVGKLKRDFQLNIDDFGRPDWSSIDPRTYPVAPHGMIAHAHPIAPIITTRGCPYSCTYCSAPITAGKRMRYRDPKNVVDEIEMLVNDFGVKEIQIEDDNFTLNRKHCITICEEILKRGIKVLWSLPNGVRIDKLDKEMLLLFKKAGCVSMALGIESANQRILDMIKKELNQEIVKKVVQDVADVGIETVGFFMIGFPTETKQEIENTINFALELPLTRAIFAKVTPLPGTELFDLWEEKYSETGKVDWKTFNYYQFDADWADCSFEEIAKLQTRATFRFYMRPKQLLTMLKQLNFAQYKRAITRLAKILLGTRTYNTVISKEGTIRRDDITKQQIPSM